MNPKLSHKDLTSVLDYDPDTGVFTWVIAGWRRRRTGDIAGSINNAGYWRIGLGGIQHQAHRLAWFYVNGEWPKGEIDHRNGIKTDNRIVNLRIATPSENASNRRKASVNKSGAKGVSIDRSTGHWRAILYKDYQKHCLGSYATVEEAAAVVERERARLHGDFARTA